LEDLKIDMPDAGIEEATPEEEKAYIAGYEDGFETSTIKQTLMDMD
jgi:hypothetical protein